MKIAGHTLSTLRCKNYGCVVGVSCLTSWLSYHSQMYAGTARQHDIRTKEPSKFSTLAKAHRRPVGKRHGHPTATCTEHLSSATPYDPSDHHFKHGWLFSKTRENIPWDYGHFTLPNDLFNFPNQAKHLRWKLAILAGLQEQLWNVWKGMTHHGGNHWRTTTMHLELGLLRIFLSPNAALFLGFPKRGEKRWVSGQPLVAPPNCLEVNHLSPKNTTATKPVTFFRIT